jgi:glyoxylase-like metal-dependent hydrolase (beta-lactamase superfamily II)
MKLLIIALILWITNAFSVNKEITSYSFEKLAKDVYIIHGPAEEPSVENKGFMNNPGLIVAKKGLIIIDPGATYQTGKMVVREAKKISNKDIIAIFNTHVHGDHWLGNGAIKEAFPKVKIYGHKKMIQRAKDSEAEVWLKILSNSTKGLSDDTKAVIPTLPIKHLDIIMAGGDKFIIHSPFAKTHTNTDIMIEHIKTKTIFMGDNDFIDRIGRFDSTSSMINNLKIFDYVQKKKMKYFVPGHGRSGDFNSAAKPFRDYLQIVYEEAKRAYDDDLEAFEVKNTAIKRLSKYHKWQGFDDKIGKQLSTMKLEIEALDF